MTLPMIADIATIVIAILAFSLSIWTVWRDNANRQFDMLHQINLTISDLNRRIAETMVIEGDKKLKQLQKEAFKEELINQYEFLAFLINRQQIKSDHFFLLDKKHIEKIENDQSIKNGSYPELCELFNRRKQLDLSNDTRH